MGRVPDETDERLAAARVMVARMRNGDDEQPPVTTAELLAEMRKQTSALERISETLSLIESKMGNR